MFPLPVSGLKFEKKFESLLNSSLRDGGARLPSTGPAQPGCLNESFTTRLEFLLVVPTRPADRPSLPRLFLPVLFCRTPTMGNRGGHWHRCLLKLRSKAGARTRPSLAARRRLMGESQKKTHRTITHSETAEAAGPSTVELGATALPHPTTTPRQWLQACEGASWENIDFPKFSRAHFPPR